MRAVVLVEGASDQRALTVLARRRGDRLAARGVSVLAMGGATNIGRYLEQYGPPGRGLHLAGLCDASEEAVFRSALTRLGVGAPRTRAGLEALGFGVCEADLEDELMRALGPDGVLAVLTAQGALASFRRLQQQPAQRGRSDHDQLRRFLGGRSGNKQHYAGLFAEAVDLDRAPRPLRLALDHAVGAGLEES